METGCGDRVMWIKDGVQSEEPGLYTFEFLFRTSRNLR